MLTQQRRCDMPGCEEQGEQCTLKVDEDDWTADLCAEHRQPAIAVFATAGARPKATGRGSRYGTERYEKYRST